MRKLLLLSFIPLGLSACQETTSTPRQFARFERQSTISSQSIRRNGMQVYFGNLHTHTSFSDGILNPREAYRMSAGNGLDFQAITEHNHSAAGGDDKIWLTPERYDELKATAKEFSVPGKFAALYGQEFSTISKGNHINVFNAASVINVPNGDFKQLYEKWLPAHPEVAFIQFNHPNYLQDLGLAPDPSPPARAAAAEELRHQQSEMAEEAQLFPQERGGNSLFNDYGYDDYKKNFGALAKAASPYLRTIEILNGPGTMPKPIGKAEAQHEQDYLAYLNEGFKLAPSADQDNHFAHWGSLHTGRTGVLATELTPAGIYEAIRARRVFASEDTNLELVMQANGHYMGSQLPPAAEVNLAIEIKDPDEPQVSYMVQVFADQPSKEMARPIAQQQLAAAGTLSINWKPLPGSENYAFVKVIQFNANGSQDEVWTAPVWITPVK